MRADPRRRLAFRYPACSDAARGDPKQHKLGFGPGDDMFAKLFCPKPALCNKVFELSMDELRFVSYPVVCREEHEGEISLFNVVFITGTETFYRGLRRHAVDSGASLQELRRRYHAVATQLAAALLREERCCRYVSSNTNAMLGVKEQLRKAGETGARHASCGPAAG